MLQSIRLALRDLPGERDGALADAEDGHRPELQPFHRVHGRQPHPLGALRGLPLDAEHRYAGGLQLLLRGVQGEVEACAHADLVRGQTLVQQAPHPVHQGLGLLLTGGVALRLGAAPVQQRTVPGE